MELTAEHKTIAAISTPKGSGGVAMIRVSGPQAIEMVMRLWKGSDLREAASHTLHLGILNDESGVGLDQVVAAIYRAPRSYTGEETVELTLHGSPYLQRRAMEALVAVGVSPAGAGEFTRRAYLNGRLDLAQAEGVADLIAADSRAASRVALQQVSGSYSSRFRELRDKLITLASLLELELDFSEEDVEFADRTQLRQGVAEVMEHVERLERSFKRGRIYKEGLPVALAGMPNVGKSSLLNALLEEEKALVSDIPGTTRDIIEGSMEIGGILCRFYDTAGLHTTEDYVEQLGIERARERISTAGIVLWLLDPTRPLAPQLAQRPEVTDPATRVIPVITKTDLTGSVEVEEGCGAFAGSGEAEEGRGLFVASEEAEAWDRGFSDPKEAEAWSRFIAESDEEVIRISSKSGEGLRRLEGIIAEAAGGAPDETQTTVTNLRHYEELRQATPYLQRLSRALTPTTGMTESQNGITESQNGLTKSQSGMIESPSAGLTEYWTTDLIAEELRGALTHLSAIVGDITTPDLLQTIFSRFCIGK